MFSQQFTLLELKAKLLNRGRFISAGESGDGRRPAFGHRRTHAQVSEGRSLLQRYYEKFIASAPVMEKPLGVESRIAALIQFDNVEFSLSGRYDRLDWMGDELHLIDYKTSKAVNIPEGIDVQLGLYYLALEQVYGHALKRLSLIFLRSGECLSFDVTPDHREQVRWSPTGLRPSLISDLAIRLKHDTEWAPQEGDYCDRCTYQKYCSARCEVPEELPEGGRSLVTVPGI